MIENIDYEINEVNNHNDYYHSYLVCRIYGNKNHNFSVLKPIIYLYDNINNENILRLFLEKIYSHSLPEKLVPKLYEIFKNKNLSYSEKIDKINLMIIES